MFIYIQSLIFIQYILLHYCVAIIMSPSKKKVCEVHRAVQKSWRISYYCVDINWKPTCLICNKPRAVAKEYNVKTHYETISLLQSSVSTVISYVKIKWRHWNWHWKNSNQFLRGWMKLVMLQLGQVTKIASEIAVSSKSFSEGVFYKKMFNPRLRRGLPVKMPSICEYKLVKKYNCRKN